MKSNDLMVKEERGGACMQKNQTFPNFAAAFLINLVKWCSLWSLSQTYIERFSPDKARARRSSETRHDTARLQGKGGGASRRSVVDKLPIVMSSNISRLVFRLGGSRLRISASDINVSSSNGRVVSETRPFSEQTCERA